MVHVVQDILNPLAWLMESVVKAIPKSFVNKPPLLNMAIHNMQGLTMGEPTQTLKDLSLIIAGLSHTTLTFLPSITAISIVKYVLQSKPANIFTSIYTRGMILQLFRLGKWMRSRSSLTLAILVLLKPVGGLWSLQCIRRNLLFIAFLFMKKTSIMFSLIRMIFQRTS